MKQMMRDGDGGTRHGSRVKHKSQNKADQGKAHRDGHLTFLSQSSQKNKAVKDTDRDILQEARKQKLRTHRTAPTLLQLNPHFSSPLMSH